ncbi:hypothetical protein K439DRAFT_1622738 [Ramaria rubella]|nr:hypothetical protein K439DRAFT_1622738 [Ramaria rubella]
MLDGAALAAPAVAEMCRFSNHWRISKALAVITSTSIGNIGCTGGRRNVSVRRLLVHQQGTCSYYCECLVLYAIHMDGIEHKHWERWRQPTFPTLDHWCTQSTVTAPTTLWWVPSQWWLSSSSHQLQIEV